MAGVWSERIKAILEDPERATLAAAVYFAVQSALMSPIQRKRAIPEEGIMNEAHRIREFIKMERQAEIARKENV